MKNKNEKDISSKKGYVPAQPGKNADKKEMPGSVDLGRVVDNTKARAGRGLANEGTNVSYDEEA